MTSNPSPPLLDLRQTPEYSKYLSQTGWQVIPKPFSVFVKNLGPLGSLIKIQRPPPTTPAKWSLFFNKVKNLAQAHRALMVKIEPHLPLPLSDTAGSQSAPKKFSQLADTFYHHGFHPDSWPLLPTRTVILDLQPSLKTIHANFKKDTRYCLRKAQKNNLKIKTGNFDTFYSHWQAQARRKHLWIPNQKNYKSLVKSFGEKALVLNCSVTAAKTPQDQSSPTQPLSQTVNTNQPSAQWLAGVLLLLTPNTTYYHYASSSKLGKKLHAPYLLVWESLKLTKKRGRLQFDFEGITDPRFKSTRKWIGFSHFKRAFGGREVIYPGSFTKYYGVAGKFLEFSEKLFG